MNAVVVNFLLQRDAVNHLQERQRTRFDDVGADGAARDRLAVVLRLQVRLAQCVLPDGDAADAEIR